jgi:hypothetical protein
LVHTAVILTSFEYLNGGITVVRWITAHYTTTSCELIDGTATDVTGKISGFENIIGGSNN